jgi:hypothetical protein
MTASGRADACHVTLDATDPFSAPVRYLPPALRALCGGTLDYGGMGTMPLRSYGVVSGRAVDSRLIVDDFRHPIVGLLPGIGAIEEFVRAVATRGEPGNVRDR